MEEKMRNLRGYKPSKSDGESLKRLGLDEQTVEKYSGKSEDELISELVRSVRMQKANGTFDGARLKSLIAAVSPSLTSEQRKRLSDLSRLIDDGVL